jgi:hypothetical protein
MLIAYSVAIPLGMLYTRVIEHNKADALKVNAWHFDSYMTLSDTAFCQKISSHFYLKVLLKSNLILNKQLGVQENNY